VAAPSLWAGIDAGKLDHHCVLIDASGERLLSRRVRNDEAALTALIDDVIALADGGLVQWAIDLNAGGAALVISLLLARDQHLLYIPGASCTTPRRPTAATARPTPRTRPSSPTKHVCAETYSSSVTVTNSPWSCVPCAPAALTSLPTGTGPSTVCAPNYSSISPPW